MPADAGFLSPHHNRLSLLSADRYLFVLEAIQRA